MTENDTPSVDEVPNPEYHVNLKLNLDVFLVLYVESGF